MKKLMLLLLLSVISIAIADNRPNMKRVQDEFKEVGSKASEKYNAHGEAKKNLLQTTEEGRAYSSVRKDWFGCIDVHGRESQNCHKMYRDLEHALANLQQTLTYKKKYLHALKDKEYYSEKWEALHGMIGFMGDESRLQYSEESVMLAAIEEIKEKPYRGAPSTIFVEMSHDLVAIQEEVRKDLRNFVQEITKH